MSDGDSFDRMMHDECEKERAALEAENAELVTKCNRLTALVSDAEEFAESGANDSEASEEWKSDCRDFLSRAKAELEGKHGN